MHRKCGLWACVAALLLGGAPVASGCQGRPTAGTPRTPPNVAQPRASLAPARAARDQGTPLPGDAARREAPPPGDSEPAGSGPAGYRRATGPRPLDFPADSGPHDAYQTEWWYYTGNLTADGGEHFGYQLTFFRRALLPPGEVAARGLRLGHRPGLHGTSGADRCGRGAALRLRTPGARRGRAGRRPGRPISRLA